MPKIYLSSFKENFLSRTFMILYALALAYINEILHYPSVRSSWFSGNTLDLCARGPGIGSCPHNFFLNIIFLNFLSNEKLIGRLLFLFKKQTISQTNHNLY